MPIDTDEKREALFWNTCLPARAVFAATATIAELRGVRLLELLMATYLGGWGLFMLRNFVRAASARVLRERAVRASEPERTHLAAEIYQIDHGNFGGRVWWQEHRLVHGTLLIVYAALTYASLPHAYAFALADVAYAFAVGVLYYRVKWRPCQPA